MRTLRGFVNEAELAELRALRVRPGFEPGRQGTGYDRLPVLDLSTLGMRMKCLRELGMPVTTPHDCFLLRFPPGSHIPPHRDLVDPEREHHRINILVDEAPEGGELVMYGMRYPLHAGDAYAFRPDLEEHEVTPVIGATRYVFSVGALHESQVAYAARQRLHRAPPPNRPGDRIHDTFWGMGHLVMPWTDGRWWAWFEGWFPRRQRLQLTGYERDVQTGERIPSFLNLSQRSS